MEAWPIEEAIRSQQRRPTPTVADDKDDEEVEEEELAAAEKQLKRKVTGKAPVTEPRPKKAKQSAP